MNAMHGTASPRQGITARYCPGGHRAVHPMPNALYRLAAFTIDPLGGNPAGVWLGDALPEPAEMQRIAAAVGFSETAFVAPMAGLNRTVRYFSPEIEVPFCGHATIATGVILGELCGAGIYRLTTQVGDIPVAVEEQAGQWQATLTSVEPDSRLAAPKLVSEVLEVLGWDVADLDGSIPAALAYAGAWHLVLAVNSAARLAALNYDFDGLKAIMKRERWLTLQLIWREDSHRFQARNPFPIGGVIEDPATGAAAAALGGYLRSANLISVPATIVIRQGEAMGRPSRIQVDIPIEGGIRVTGQAIRL
jgi:PhzF family phenazine biosynthesis protein